MIQELDIIVLTHDIEEHNLKQGDVGTVVHRYREGEVFEVEFVTAEGKPSLCLPLLKQRFGR